jgi:hypothetical protein
VVEASHTQKLETSTDRTLNQKRAGGMAENLPSKHETLSVNYSTASYPNNNNNNSKMLNLFACYYTLHNQRSI